MFTISDVCVRENLVWTNRGEGRGEGHCFPWSEKDALIIVITIQTVIEHFDAFHRYTSHVMPTIFCYRYGPVVSTLKR